MAASIITVLEEMNDGTILRLLDRQLADVLRAVAKHGKPGEVQITLKVEPSGEGRFRFAPAIKGKVPEGDVEKSLFFWDTETGDLSARDPRQPRLFDKPPVGVE